MVFRAPSPCKCIRSRRYACCTFPCSFFCCTSHARQLPFVPTKKGVLPASAVVLAPAPDAPPLAEKYLNRLLPSTAFVQKSFFSATENDVSTAFLRLAGAKVLQDSEVISLVTTSRKALPMRWWYEFYTYLAKSERLASKKADFYQGLRLLPTMDNTILTVPSEKERLVCFPIPKQETVPSIPAYFSSILVFLDPQLATLIRNGDIEVRKWVQDRLRVTPFETTEFLRRAVALIAPLFSGERKITFSELQELWVLIFDDHYKCRIVAR